MGKIRPGMRHLLDTRRLPLGGVDPAGLALLGGAWALGWVLVASALADGHHGPSPVLTAAAAGAFSTVALARLLRKARHHDRRALLRAQGALAGTGRRLSGLFANSPEPMLVHDPTTLCVLEANAAAATLYGWSTDDLRRLCLEDIQVEGDLQAMR